MKFKSSIKFPLIILYIDSTTLQGKQNTRIYFSSTLIVRQDAWKYFIIYMLQYVFWLLASDKGFNFILFVF